MLIWQRKNGGRDLYLDDSCELPVEEFEECRKNFFTAANNAVDKNLREALIEFPQRRVLTCDERNLRSGYIGLYRRCVTTQKKYKGSQAEANMLWRFLFGPLPVASLAEDPAYKGASLLVDSEAWELWFEKLRV